MSNIKIGSRVLTEEGLASIFPNYNEVFDSIKDLRSRFNTARGNNVDFTTTEVHDNVISILGERGSGKTSALLTLKEVLENGLFEFPNKKIYSPQNDIFLPLINPEIIENNTLLGVLIGFLYEEVEKSDVIWKKLIRAEQSALVNFLKENSITKSKYEQKNNINCYESNLENPVKKAYKSLQQVYVKREDQYKDILSKENLEKYIDEISESLYSDVNIIDKFKYFIDYLILFKRYSSCLNICDDSTNCDKLNQSNKEPLIHIFFDDMDLIQKKQFDILKDILTYLSIPNIVVYLAGDFNNMLEGLTISYLKEDDTLDDEFLDLNFLDLNSSNIEKQTLTKKRTLAYDFLRKLLSPSKRFELKSYNLKSRMNFIPTDFDNKNNSKYDSIENLLKSIFKDVILDDKRYQSLFKDYTFNLGYSVIFDNKPRGLINVYSYLYDLNSLIDNAKQQSGELNSIEKRELLFKIQKLFDITISSNNNFQDYKNILDSFVDIDIDRLYINFDCTKIYDYSKTLLENPSSNYNLRDLIDLNILFLFFSELTNSLNYYINSSYNINTKHYLCELINQMYYEFQLISKDMDLFTVISIYGHLCDSYNNSFDLKENSIDNIVLKYLDILSELSLKIEKKSNFDLDTIKHQDSYDNTNKNKLRNDNYLYKITPYKKALQFSNDLDLYWLEQLGHIINKVKSKKNYVSEGIDETKKYLDELADTEFNRIKKVIINKNDFNIDNALKNLIQNLFNLNQLPNSLKSITNDISKDDFDVLLKSFDDKDELFYLIVYIFMRRLKFLQSKNVNLSSAQSRLSSNFDILRILNDKGLKESNIYKLLAEEQYIYDNNYNINSIQSDLNKKKVEYNAVLAQKLTQQDLYKKIDSLDGIIKNLSNIEDLIKIIESKEGYKFTVESNYNFETNFIDEFNAFSSEVYQLNNNNNNIDNRKNILALYDEFITIYDNLIIKLQDLNELVSLTNHYILKNESNSNSKSLIYELLSKDNDNNQLEKILTRVENSLTRYIQLLDRNKNTLYADYNKYNKLKNEEKSLLEIKEKIEFFSINNFNTVINDLKDILDYKHNIKLNKYLNLNQNKLSFDNLIKQEFDYTESYIDFVIPKTEYELFQLKNLLEGLLFDYKFKLQQKNGFNKIKNIISYDESDEYIKLFNELLKSDEISQKSSLKKSFEHLKEQLLIGIEEQEYKTQLKDLDKLIESTSFYIKSIKKSIDTQYQINDFDINKLETVSLLITVAKKYVEVFKEYKLLVQRDSTNKEDILREAIKEIKAIENDENHEENGNFRRINIFINQNLE